MRFGSLDTHGTRFVPANQEARYEDQGISCPCLPVIGAELIGLKELGIAWDAGVVRHLEESVPRTMPQE